MGDVYECQCDPLTALEIAAEEGELEICKFIIDNAKEETLPAFKSGYIFYDIRRKVLKLLNEFYQDKDSTAYLYFAESFIEDKQWVWRNPKYPNYEEIYTYLEEFEKWNDDRI